MGRSHTGVSSTGGGLGACGWPPRAMLEAPVVQGMRQPGLQYPAGRESIGLCPGGSHRHKHGRWEGVCGGGGHSLCPLPRGALCT